MTPSHKRNHEHQALLRHRLEQMRLASQLYEALLVAREKRSGKEMAKAINAWERVVYSTALPGARSGEG